MSATLKELRIVESTAVGGAAGLGVDDLTGAARRLDLLTSRLREAVGVHGQCLGELPATEDLDRDPLAGGQSDAAEGVEVDGRAVVEARLEVLEVDRLRVRPERLERHRHLLVRAAQLAHPHVDRVLAALEAGPVLGAGAGAVAPVAAAGGLAVARAVAAADALAVLARAGRGLEVVQPDRRGIDGLRRLVRAAGRGGSGVSSHQSVSFRSPSRAPSPAPCSSTVIRW